ncbi:MAG: TonB-dependent receptor [Acidobacteriaceae bacterium]|nr:TonB-dependent receptor [Acidobacteriaceae bacterium]
MSICCLHRIFSLCKTNPLTAVSVLTLILVFFASPSSAFGQGQTAFASVSGEVRDSSGAVVVGATATLSSSATGIRRTFQTDGAGRYAFTQIPPGTYSLSVTHPGFTTYVQNGLALEIGQVAVQDVALAVGNVNQQIVVTAEAPPLNTANANLGADVSERQITQLPLDYRAPFLLVTLLSSVNTGQIWQSFNSGTQLSGPGADQDASAFTFGGSRFGDTGFLLDGHWNGSSAWNAIMYSPSVDETQEFRIQQNVFTAQYGRSMGNVVNAITKSGTSELHGDAFEFLRNSDLDANNFFNNRAGLTKPHFERNQFGATIGGPVWIPKVYRQRNKTFFFGGYEGLRQSTPLTAVLTAPLAPFRNGDFSSLLGAPAGIDGLGRPVYGGQIYNPFTTRTIAAGQVDPATGLIAQQTGYVRDPFPGNRIPANLINPVAAKVASYYPSPNGPGSVNNYTSTIGVPASQDKYTVRVDQNITDDARLFVRWSQAFMYKTRNGAFFGPDNPAGYGEQAGNNRYDLGLGFSYSFNPTFVMSASAGINRWVETRTEQGYPFAPSQLGLPSFFDTLSNQFPDFYVSGTASLGGSAAQSHYISQTQSASVDFTKVSGSHTIGFGYQYIFFIQNSQNKNLGSFNFGPDFTQGPDPTTANPNTGYGFASFLLGTGDGGGFPLNANPAFSQKYNAWYLQDEWKITPKLTATIGLRYDIQFAPTERHNGLSNFNFTGTNPIASALAAANGGTAPISTPGYLVYLNGNSRSLYDTGYLNFAPRVSIAYAPTSKLVVRSGFGTFYVSNYPLWSLPTQGFSQFTPYVGTVNGLTPVNTLSNPYPNGLIQPIGSSLGALTNVGQSVSAVGRTRSSPYVEQWSLSTQYAFTNNDVFEISYFGNHGLKLDYNDIQLNQLNPQYLSLGNALLAPVKNPFYGVITSSSCGLNQPTVPYGQLLRPYPQYCGVDQLQPPGASSWYHAMTAQFNHRFSHGVQMLASYTWSKYLDNSQGMQQWVSGPASSVTNWYNLAAQKSVDANDVPHSLVVSFIAQLPFGKGKTVGSNWGRVTNAVAGGWEVSSVASFKSGLPLGVYADTNNTNSFGGGQRPNIVGNVGAVPQGVDRVNEWFNTAAFAQPAPFTFGNAPRFFTNPRGPGFQNIDLGLDKNFHPWERGTIQFRAEFFNTLNHANFYLPDTGFGDPGFGSLTQALPARDIQFGLKILF